MTLLNLPDMPTTPMEINGVMPIEWQEFFRNLYQRVGGQITVYDLDGLEDVLDLIFGQLTTNRIVATDVDKYLVSVERLDSWISGTINQITVGDNGNGTVTLSLPQDIDTDADVEFDSILLDDLTANRLTASDGSKNIVSVSDLTNWIAGTVNQITVTDDTDGSVTLSTPQDIDTDADVVFDTAELDLIEFTEAALEPTERQLTWNADDGTLNVGLYNDVILQLGQEQHFYAQNVSGSQIDDGQPVMFAGTIGASGKLKIDFAEADVTIPTEYFMGLATHSIANTDFGYVTSFGLVRGIDTTGTGVGEVWNDGDLLYLSTTAGQLTLTPPTAPDPKVLVAAVVYSHATIGSLFVRPTFGDYLSSLHDVYITSIADNDILIWDNANSRWVNTSDITVDSITVNTAGYMSGDNVKLYFGAGNDMSIDYDGTDGNIDTSLVAASDLLITCGTQKTLELQNHVYKDINIGGLNFGGPVATNPDEVELVDNTGTATGIYSRGFAVGEKASAIKELQHDYAEGENISFHIHWQGNAAPTGTDNVQWQLTYTVAQGGETLDPVTTLTIETAIDTQYEMYTSVFSTITGTNYKIGDQLCLTLERIAASANEYGGDAVIFTGGTHYPLNTLGSRQIAIK